MDHMGEGHAFSRRKAQRPHACRIPFKDDRIALSIGDRAGSPLSVGKGGEQVKIPVKLFVGACERPARLGCAKAVARSSCERFEHPEGVGHPIAMRHVPQPPYRSCTSMRLRMSAEPQGAAPPVHG